MKDIINRLKSCSSRYGNQSMLDDKIDAIKGLMASEKSVDYSDEEIERCLSKCVGGHVLVHLAKELRDQKLL